MTYQDVSSKRLAELLSLKGRTAVVTGGATGIGKAICLRLAEAGANLVIGDLDAAGARALAVEVSRYGGKHVGMGVDVARHASVTALADEAMATTGRIDIWVNNAGVFPYQPVLEIDDAEWDRVLGINLRGTFSGAKDAALRMVRNQGVIINIASCAAFNASDGSNGAHYVSSKHAVLGLTKSLAVELGPQGIRVVGVAPTLVDTPGARKGLEAKGAPDFLAQYAQALPLKRVGLPDDIARTVLFAASDLATYVTGVMIPVDGGDLAR